MIYHLREEKKHKFFFRITSIKFAASFPLPCLAVVVFVIVVNREKKEMVEK